MKIKIKFIIGIVTCTCLGISSNFIETNANDVVESLNSLVMKYLHNGTYKKETIINLNESTQMELSSIFHAGSDVLERVTYYQDDALWMSNGKGKYSYYGTSEDGHLLNATVERVGKTSNSIAIKNKTMEDHYYTLRDIVASYDHNWTFNNGVYYSDSIEVIEWFKGFTAPCYLGFNEETSNYIIFSGVEIEEKSDGLELRLLASSINEAMLKEGSNNIFSKALITYNHKKDEINNIIFPTDLEDGILNYRCSICSEIVEEKLDRINGKEIDTYPSLSNADIINYQGNIYTYGGSPDGINRIDAIYCFNTYSNKLYELDVKLLGPSTSHRVIKYQDKAYIFGGLYNGQRYDTVQIHDLKNNTIEILEKRLPFGINCFQVGVYQDKAYFIAGSKTGGSTNKIYEFSFITNEVTELKVTLPTNVFKGGWCVIDQYVYIMGGTNGSRLDTIFRFNMISKEVEEMKGKLPYNISQLRLAYDGYNRIYAYGGTNTKNELVNDVFVYDLDKDEVQTLDLKLPIKIANTCVTNIDNVIYILGGDNLTNNIVWKHNNNQIIELM